MRKINSCYPTSEEFFKVKQVYNQRLFRDYKIPIASLMRNTMDCVVKWSKEYGQQSEITATQLKSQPNRTFKKYIYMYI